MACKISIKKQNTVFYRDSETFLKKKIFKKNFIFGHFSIIYHGLPLAENLPLANNSPSYLSFVKKNIYFSAMLGSIACRTSCSIFVSLAAKHLTSSSGNCLIISSGSSTSSLLISIPCSRRLSWIHCFLLFSASVLTTLSVWLTSLSRVLSAWGSFSKNLFVEYF